MAFGVKNFPTSLDDLLTLLPARDTAAALLTASLATGATSMSVDDTSRFPTAGTLVFKGEHIGYTGKTSTSFTGLTRANFTADGGAAAQSGVIGDPVRLAMTARHHNVLAETINAIEAKLGIGATTPTTAGHVLRASSAGVSAWAALVAADISNFTAAVNALIPAQYVEPTGVIKLVLDGGVPSGYLELNGQAVSRSTYSALFTMYSTKYGVGNGSTTFNLPNLTGKTVFGYSGAGDFAAIGNTGGLADVTLSAAESGSPAHGHGHSLGTNTTGAHVHGMYITEQNAAAGVNIPAWRYGVSITQNTSSAGDHSHTITGGVTNSSPVAASAAHENLPPYMVGVWIVKT